MSTTLAAMMEAFFILGLLCEQEIKLPSLILGNVAMTKRIPVRQQKPVSLEMMLSARPRNGKTKLPELSRAHHLVPIHEAAASDRLQPRAKLFGTVARGFGHSYEVPRR